MAVTCWARTGLPEGRFLDQTGHFGEWLQGRLGPYGPVALVSLPYPRPVLRACHLAGRLPLHVRGAGIGSGDARRFLQQLGCNLTGRVRLRALMPAGQGLGLSTARLVALARLAGFSGPSQTLARTCLRAEGASDPLWHRAPEQILWASREGRILRQMPALPAYQIIGGLWGPGQRTDPQDRSFPDVTDLVASWQSATNLQAFAMLASESAARCSALRGPSDDPTARLAQDIGALGWVAAHTGSARGLIFAPGTAPDKTAAQLRAAGFRFVTAFQGGVR